MQYTNTATKCKTKTKYILDLVAVECRPTSDDNANGQSNLPIAIAMPMANDNAMAMRAAMHILGCIYQYDWGGAYYIIIMMVHDKR